MSVEDLLNECGGFGKYQILIIFWVFIHKTLSGWSIMQMAFAGFAPDWHCEVTEGATHHVPNSNETLKTCSLNNNNTGFNEMHCNSYWFEGSSKTAITDWDLVCEKKWVKATITSIQMAGVLVGSIVSGQFSDLFGRKKTLFGFALSHSLLNIGAAFSPSWEMFAVFRFFIGIGIGSILVVTLPYGMEFMPTKWRPLMSIVPHFSVGISLFALAAMLLENWMYLHIVLGALGLPTLIGWLYVPESVRWLTMKGRLEAAERIFEKMAAVNGRPPPNELRIVLEKLYQEEKELKSSGKKYSYWDLFKGWQRTKITLIACYVWFMLSLVCYGIAFGVSALSGNLYLNIFLVSMVEVPLIISTFYFNNRVGRKWTFIVLSALGAMAACACLVVKVVVPSDDQGRWITGFSIVSKMFLGAGWTVFQTWACELYPTVIRSLGYGLVNMAARVGGILSPFAVDLDNRPLIAYAIITAMVLVGIFVSFFVPETKGTLLSDALTDKMTSSEEKGEILLETIGQCDHSKPNRNNGKTEENDNNPSKADSNGLIVQKF